MKQYGIFFNPISGYYGLNDRGVLAHEPKHIVVRDVSDLGVVINKILEQNPDKKKKMMITTSIPKDFFSKSEEVLRNKYGSRIEVVYSPIEYVDRHFAEVRAKALQQKPEDSSQ